MGEITLKSYSGHPGRESTIAICNEHNVVLQVANVEHVSPNSMRKDYDIVTETCPVEGCKSSWTYRNAG